MRAGGLRQERSNAVETVETRLGDREALKNVDDGARNRKRNGGPALFKAFEPEFKASGEDSSFAHGAEDNDRSDNTEVDLGEDGMEEGRLVEKPFAVQEDGRHHVHHDVGNEEVRHVPVDSVVVDGRAGGLAADDEANSVAGSSVTLREDSVRGGEARLVGCGLEHLLALFFDNLSDLACVMGWRGRLSRGGGDAFENSEILLNPGFEVIFVFECEFTGHVGCCEERGWFSKL